MTLVVVRHAWAGDPAAWDDDDRLRPLDDRGRRQAAALPDALAHLSLRRIVSSPFLRCVQTVEPLARVRGLELEHAPELGEDRAFDDGPAFLRELLGEDAVACVHGNVRAALGVDRFPKGSAWLFDGALANATLLAGA